MKQFLRYFNTTNLLAGFNGILHVVFSFILIFLAITLIIGTFRIFFHIGAIIEGKELSSRYLHIFYDVLTLMILVELSRSLVEYFTENRLRLTYILDAGIVFILRDIMIMLFEQKMKSVDLYSYSAVLLVLGIIRFGTIYTYTKEKTMLRDHPNS